MLNAYTYHVSVGIKHCHRRSPCLDHSTNWPELTKEEILSHRFIPIKIIAFSFFFVIIFCSEFLWWNGVRFTPLVLNTIGGALSFLYSLTPILWVRCPAQLKCRIVKFGCLIKQQWAWVILSYFIWCCPADWLQIWTWCLYLSVNIRIKIFVLSVISVLYLQDIATLRLQQWSCCMETVIMFALMLCPWHMRETSANLMLGGLWPHDQCQVAHV